MDELDKYLSKDTKKVEKPSQSRSISLHVNGKWDLNYLQKLKIALKFLFGGNLYYSFCNAVKPSFGQDKDYLGMEHAGSTAQIVITLGEPDHAPTEKIHPVTHLRVKDAIKDINELQPL